MEAAALVIELQREKGIIMKNKKFIICLSIVLVYCVLCAGCGSKSKNTIVGTWESEDGKRTMRFYEDGTCLDLPFTGISGEVTSYKLQEDGMLILKYEWDGQFTLQPTESEEDALNYQDVYYLSGKKLVLDRKLYRKQSS